MNVLLQVLYNYNVIWNQVKLLSIMYHMLMIEVADSICCHQRGRAIRGRLKNNRETLCYNVPLRSSQSTYPLPPSVSLSSRQQSILCITTFTHRLAFTDLSYPSSSPSPLRFNAPKSPFSYSLSWVFLVRHFHSSTS